MSGAQFNPKLGEGKQLTPAPSQAPSIPAARWGWDGWDTLSAPQPPRYYNSQRAPRKSTCQLPPLLHGRAGERATPLHAGSCSPPLCALVARGSPRPAPSGYSLLVQPPFYRSQHLPGRRGGRPIGPPPGGPAATNCGNRRERRNAAAALGASPRQRETDARKTSGRVQTSPAFGDSRPGCGGAPSEFSCAGVVCEGRNTPPPFPSCRCFYNRGQELGFENKLE